MGNFLSGNNHMENRSSFENDGQDYRPKTSGSTRKPPCRPPPPSSNRQPKRSGQTDDIIESIDNHLTVLQTSVRTLRGNNSEEVQRQLYKMMSDTEKDLDCINQQMQHSKNDGDSNEEVLQAVLKQNEILKERNKKLESEVLKSNKIIQQLQSENSEYTSQLRSLKVEKEDLLLRLSKLTIADLSDRNRPTKLGELHSEIYDNEWTDAFEALQAARCTEEFAIETLHLTLINVFDFCKSKSECMLLKTEDAVNFLFEEYRLLQQTHRAPHMSMPVKRISGKKLPSKFENDVMLYKRWQDYFPKRNNAIGNRMKIKKPDDILDHVKVLQKGVAESMVPVVQEAYMTASWVDGIFTPELESFIQKCVFLCWMMVVQSPAMCFHQIDAYGSTDFDKNMYKEYTKSGELVKFVVWPALLLHEKGSLMCMGIAQGENIF
ncbi:uncharacterized protein LOC132732027 [Ruditapes philippinarum]|uniref:uncharacterized protein LOC132732027 n=1 Tax=Ruditapes philippinarum TaxID=129788 RepID=UPI00295B7A96|nr:uncharacterized protein LOC132732027 [Ruditapes philippinarum]